MERFIVLHRDNSSQGLRDLSKRIINKCARHGYRVEQGASCYKNACGSELRCDLPGQAASGAISNKCDLRWFRDYYRPADLANTFPVIPAIVLEYSKRIYLQNGSARSELR